MSNKTPSRRSRTFKRWLFSTLLVAVSSLCFFAAIWYVDTYGEIGFDAILYTVTADLAGVEKELILSFTKKVLVRVFFCTVGVSIVLFFPFRKRLVFQFRDSLRFPMYPLNSRVCVGICVALSMYFLFSAAVDSEMIDFLGYIGNPSTFYENSYCAPETVTIEFPEKKRNLIYIHLESMENSFLSVEEGGALPYNTIPELTQLARENISFSHNDQLGGPFSTSGTTWTVGALVSYASGIPLKIPMGMDVNQYGADGVYLPGISTLNDILAENGYNQAIMYGSDANFAGRRQFYAAHGVENFYDHSTAMEDGIIPDGYDVWWGMEDLYLYEYAKKILPQMAAREEPFYFSMLTADTHHVAGYVCSLCEDAYREQYENVYSCASKQAYAFILWLQQQDFYDNTTIMLVGDHPSMDGEYIRRNVDSDYDRRVYNCIINSAASTQNLQNRGMSVFDMFPTALAAIGCHIQGERLGLGTNLFSDTPTLAEAMGEERFGDEVARYSEYYMNHFF